LRTSSFSSVRRKPATAPVRPMASTAVGSRARDEERALKQAVMTAPGKIEIREIAPPMPAPAEVLLRVQRVGVCGSDVHVNHGRHPYTTYPVIQGHEYSATIEALGAEVKGLRVGAKVTSLPQIVCGSCAPCRRGD